MKCIVFQCSNTSEQGLFTESLCGPCHEFVTTGNGTNSTAYRLGIMAVDGLDDVTRDRDEWRDGYY